MVFDYGIVSNIIIDEQAKVLIKHNLKCMTKQLLLNYY